MPLHLFTLMVVPYVSMKSLANLLWGWLQITSSWITFQGLQSQKTLCKHPDTHVLHQAHRESTGTINTCRLITIKAKDHAPPEIPCGPVSFKIKPRGPWRNFKHDSRSSVHRSWIEFYERLQNTVSKVHPLLRGASKHAFFKWQVHIYTASWIGGIYRHKKFGEINTHRHTKILTCQSLRGVHCISHKWYTCHVTHQNWMSHQKWHTSGFTCRWSG